jgi:hypothetical protein
MSSGRDEVIDALFVQNAAAFSSADGALTLHGVSPATVFFIERPRREAGHLPTSRFVELWDGSFEPAVVVSFLEGPPDVSVVVRGARLEGDALTYSVDVVEGELPGEAGACTVFIDALDRPLEPVLSAPARRVRRRTE